MLLLDNDIIIEIIEMAHGLVIWLLVPVIVDDLFSYSSVAFSILLVKHDEEEVEPRQERVGQTDVLGYLLVSGIFSINGICSCDDTAPGVKTHMETRLSNSDSLLLHDLMDSYSVNIVHLIKLIDAYNSLISKYHGTCFKMLFSSVLVHGDCGCETYSR